MQPLLEPSNFTSATATISYISLIPSHLLIIPSQSPSQLALSQLLHIISKKYVIQSTLCCRTIRCQFCALSQIMILPYSNRISSPRTSHLILRQLTILNKKNYHVLCRFPYHALSIQPHTCSRCTKLHVKPGQSNLLSFLYTEGNLTFYEPNTLPIKKSILQELLPL